MAQNNSAFVWKSSSYCSGRPKLIEQSSKSEITGFYMEKNSKFGGSFS